MLWLLEECQGLDWHLKTYKRENMLAPPALKKLHPLGKSPLVTIEVPGGDGTEMVLAESGRTMEYLCDYFAQHLLPRRYQEGREGQLGGETETWMRFRYFMHYAEGSFMSLRVASVVMGRAWNRGGHKRTVADGRTELKTNPQIPFFVKPITRAVAGKTDEAFFRPNFDTHFAFLEAQLQSSPGGGDYLCGPDLTAADILMSFPLIASRMLFDEATHPRLAAYIRRLESNEKYKQGVQRVEQETGESLPTKL